MLRWTPACSHLGCTPFDAASRVAGTHLECRDGHSRPRPRPPHSFLLDWSDLSTLCAAQSVSASNLTSRSNCFGDFSDRRVDRDTVLLASVPIPERHCASRRVLAPGYQNEGHLLLLGVADLLLHSVIGGVDLDPYTGLVQVLCKPQEIVVVLARNWDANDLNRRQPGRECTRVMLGQHSEESLDRAEQ